jgi:uncharacterized membrane protein
MTTAAFRRPGRPLPTFGWWLMVAGATAVGLASARYVAGGATMAPPPLKPNFLDHPAGFYVHIGAASVALLIGPYQFLARPRRSGARFHRAMGFIYATAVAIGGAAAFTIAPTSNGGPIAAAGFLTLAALWWLTTGAAVAAILRGDRASHGRWMYRSYALTLAGVALRLYLPVAIFGPFGFTAAYAAIAWLCWVPNLMIAELLSRRARPISAKISLMGPNG